MCEGETRASTARYARDILALQDGLNFRSLLAVPRHDVAYYARRPGGLVTLGLRTDQMSKRYLLGLQGFRLAQYLQLGWVCQDTIAARGLFCEPVHGLRNSDLHLVTVSPGGEILGYLGLVGSSDEVPRLLQDPDRARFPVETAHGINLFDVVPRDRATRTDQVGELKRFVHRRSMSDRMLRLRVTLELLLAAGSLVLGQSGLRLVVGDVEEHVALRHLMLVGLQVRLIEGTTPQLRSGDYLHLAYVRRGAVKPFIAQVPAHEELAARMRRLDRVLSAEDLGLAVRDLIGRGDGTISRVAA